MEAGQALWENLAQLGIEAKVCEGTKLATQISYMPEYWQVAAHQHCISTGTVMYMMAGADAL